MGDDEKWVRGCEPEDQGGEEDESLSLCDLPINLISEQEQEEEKPLLGNGPSSEDFDFGQVLGRSKSTNSEMCAADDIFYRGQILPFRHSVSSSTISRSISRSESMDRCSSSGGFVSFSSRSSSINSHYSSSSSSAAGSNSTAADRPRFLNRFHTFPSPKPQIIKTPSGPLPGSAAVGTGNGRAKKSSIWDTLRLGLVRAPEIEFQDLKSRSRNSTSTASSKPEKQGNGKMPPAEKATTRAKNKRYFNSSNGRLLISGCDCTVGAIQPVALNNENIVVMKRNGSSKKHWNDRRRDGGRQDSGEGEEWKTRKSERTMGREEKREKGKEERSRHRTVEWIKELSTSSQA